MERRPIKNQVTSVLFTVVLWIYFIDVICTMDSRKTGQSVQKNIIIIPLNNTVISLFFKLNLQKLNVTAEKKRIQR